MYLSVLFAERMSKPSVFFIKSRLIHRSPWTVYLKAKIKPNCFSTKPGSHCIGTRQVVYCRPLRETDASSVNPTIVKKRLHDALLKYALENMTSFYNIIRADFGVECNAIDGSRRTIRLRHFVYRHFDTTVYQRTGQLYVQLLFQQIIIFINSNFYLHYDSLLSIPLPLTL